jgi:hypothetical protein
MSIRAASGLIIGSSLRPTGFQFPAGGTPGRLLGSTTVEYLVIAGGGGGGSLGGGGGGGGYRTNFTGGSGGGASPESAFTATLGTAYTVTLGAGGAGATSQSTGVGQNGSNSVFSIITSVGGGFGGSYSGRWAKHRRLRWWSQISRWSNSRQRYSKSRFCWRSGNT